MIPTFHTSWYPLYSNMTIVPWWDKLPENGIGFDFKFTVKGTIKDYPSPGAETVSFHDTTVH